MTASSTQILTVPGRGHFAAESIRSVAVEPREHLIDRATGEPCAALLVVETKNYAHRIPIATLEEATALMALGLAMMQAAATARVTVASRYGAPDMARMLRSAPLPPLAPIPATDDARIPEAAQ